MYFSAYAAAAALQETKKSKPRSSKQLNSVSRPNGSGAHPLSNGKTKINSGAAKCLINKVWGGFVLFLYRLSIEGPQHPQIASTAAVDKNLHKRA